eukprot:g3491.t1
MAAQGGVILAIGNVKLTIRGDTVFKGNKAVYQGGAVFVQGSSSMIINNSFFIENESNFIGGGAIYAESSMNRDLEIHITNTVFSKNLAKNHLGSGGAICLQGPRTNCTIERGVSFISNIAELDGGAVHTSGALQIILRQTSFIGNEVNQGAGAAFYVVASSLGSSIRVTRLHIQSSIFLQNRVNQGQRGGGAMGFTGQGAVVHISKCNFNENKALFGSGGVLHIFNGPSLMISDSNFTNNRAIQGGALHVEESTRVNISECKFLRNHAEDGGAIFAIGSVDISITNSDLKSNLAVEGGGAVHVESHGFSIINWARISITKCNISSNCAAVGTTRNAFRNIMPRGGAVLGIPGRKRNGEFMIPLLVFNFMNVLYMKDFTAELHVPEEELEHQNVTLYGQTKEVMKKSGYVHFTGARLSGEENALVTILVRFVHRGQELRMNHSYLIEVKIRPCRIGEVTNKDDNGVIECKKCGTGQFSWNSSIECKSCEGIEGVECHGSTAVPKDHYWHSSSFSRNMSKCILPRACKYEGRNSTINETESQAHSNNTQVFYWDEDSVQCAKGYKGIRCGSCQSDYGKVGDRCENCDSMALGYIFLSLLVLWSIVFVGFFIRSVLQLSKRIEFNKKYVGRLFQIRKEEIPEPAHERNLNQLQIEDSEICPDEISRLAFEVSTSQEGSTSSVSTSRLHSYIQASHPSIRDWTTIVANRRNARCSIKKLKKRSRLIVNPRKIRDRKQTGLAKRLNRLKSGWIIKRSQTSYTNYDKLSPVDVCGYFYQHNLERRSQKCLRCYRYEEILGSFNIIWICILGTMANLSTGGGYFSLDCFPIHNPFAKSLWRMVILVLYPFFIFIIFVMIWALRTIIKRKTMKYFRHRIWLAFLAIIYFFYIGLTKNLLRFFVCFYIQKDTSVQRDLGLHTNSEWHLWEEDTSVQCYKNEHLLLVLCFVVPLLCLITIGYPVGTFLILQLKATELEDENVVCTYGFLYQAYNKHYWEVTIMFRKAAIAAVTVFPQELGANVQGLLCLFILVVSLCCHLFFQPFKKEVDHLNRMESFSLSATIGVFFTGLVFNDPKTGWKTDVFLSVLAILCILGTLLLMIYHLFRSSEEVLDMLLLEKGIMDSDQLSMETVSTKLKQLYLHYVSAGGKLLQFLKRNRSTQRRQERRIQASVQLADYA